MLKRPSIEYSVDQRVMQVQTGTVSLHWMLESRLNHNLNHNDHKRYLVFSAALTQHPVGIFLRLHLISLVCQFLRPRHHNVRPGPTSAHSWQRAAEEFLMFLLKMDWKKLHCSLMFPDVPWCSLMFPGFQGLWQWFVVSEAEALQISSCSAVDLQGSIHGPKASAKTVRMVKNTFVNLCQVRNPHQTSMKLTTTMNKRNNIVEINDDKLWTMTNDGERRWCCCRSMLSTWFPYIPILIRIRISALISIAKGSSAAKWHRCQWSSVLAEANPHHAISMVLEAWRLASRWPSIYGSSSPSRMELLWFKKICSILYYSTYIVLL